MKSLILSAAMAVSLAGTAYAGGLSDPVVAPPVSAVRTPTFDHGGFYVGGNVRASTVERSTSSEYVEEYTPSEEVEITDQCVVDYTHSNAGKCAFNNEEAVLSYFGEELPRCGSVGYRENCVMKSFNGDPEGSVRVFVPGASLGDVFTYGTGEFETVYGETITETFVENVTTESDEKSYGVFVGNRGHAGSNLILGVEAGLNYNDELDETLFTFEGQVGYDAGRALPYAFIGVASLDTELGGVGGVGVDYLLTESIFVGARASYVEIENYTAENIDFRVGFNF